MSLIFVPRFASTPVIIVITMNSIIGHTGVDMK